MYLIYDYSTSEWVGGTFDTLEAACAARDKLVAYAQSCGSTITKYEVPVYKEVA